MGNDRYELHRRYKLVYSIIGLVLGLSCIIASFTGSLIGLSTILNDAAPAVIVFAVGIFMVWITRFRVTHQIIDSGSGGSPRDVSSPLAAAAAVSSRSLQEQIVLPSRRSPA